MRQRSTGLQIRQSGNAHARRRIVHPLIKDRAGAPRSGQDCEPASQGRQERAAGLRTRLTRKAQAQHRSADPLGRERAGLRTRTGGAKRGARGGGEGGRGRGARAAQGRGARRGAGIPKPASFAMRERSAGLQVRWSGNAQARRRIARPLIRDRAGAPHAEQDCEPASQGTHERAAGLRTRLSRKAQAQHRIAYLPGKERAGPPQGRKPA